MYVRVRASRVEVSGLDMWAALSVVLWGTFTAPIVMALIAGLLRWSDGAAFGAALLAHAALAAGCRYRLVVDGGGSVLARTWLGVPWWRRPYGRRPSVTTVVGWDWEELVIVPERPRDADDHLVVMESWSGGWTWEDLEASASAADREIARVATLPEPASTSPYRSPPLVKRARSGSR